jgi:ankyrin repeat protein
MAAVKGHTAVARTLLAAGADQNIRDAYGWTPLMRAVHSGREGIVRMLLDAPGTDLSARQESGATVLHVAAATGNAAIARMLVDHGADRSARDSRDRTPAAVARAAGHEELVGLLEERERAARAGG